MGNVAHDWDNAASEREEVMGLRQAGIRFARQATIAFEDLLLLDDIGDKFGRRLQDRVREGLSQVRAHLDAIRFHMSASATDARVALLSRKIDALLVLLAAGANPWPREAVTEARMPIDDECVDAKGTAWIDELDRIEALRMAPTSTPEPKSEKRIKAGRRASSSVATR